MNIYSSVLIKLLILLSIPSASLALDRLGVYELLGRAGVGDLSDWEPLFFQPDIGFIFQSRKNINEIILGWEDSSLCWLLNAGDGLDREAVRRSSEEIISLTRNAASSAVNCRGRIFFTEKPIIILSSGKSIRGDRGVVAWPGNVVHILDAFPHGLEKSIGYLLQLETVPDEIIAISSTRISFKAAAEIYLLIVPDETESINGLVIPTILSVCDFSTIRVRGFFEAGPLRNLGPEIDVAWQLVASQEGADPAAYWICGRVE